MSCLLDIPPDKCKFVGYWIGVGPAVCLVGSFCMAYNINLKISRQAQDIGPVLPLLPVLPLITTALQKK